MSTRTKEQKSTAQKLPRPQTVRLIIWGVVAVVTVRMIVAAIEHDQWREFAVSEIGVLFAAVVLTFLLRDSARNG